MAAAAAAGASTAASASSSVSYQPAPYEQSYYLGLFRAADVAGQGQIGGTDAVQFMTRSQLPMDVLKQIWTVANPPSASSSTSNSNNSYLDPKKFAIVVRLIQLTQNGQKGHGPTLQVSPTATTTAAPLRPVFFEGVSGVTVPWPASGLPPPATAGGHPPGQQVPVPSQQPPQSPLRPHNPSPPPPQQSQKLQPPMSAPSRALVGLDPYMMSPQERARYEQLFPQYATKHDEEGEVDAVGFVYGSEAVPLFLKSGVAAATLRDIWTMVDRNPVDNRLDPLEFALAMHLIVCLSKKQLPLPTGGTLPASLHALKVQHVQQQQQQQQQHMPPQPAGAAMSTGRGMAPPPPQQQEQPQQQMQMQPQMPGPPPLGMAGGSSGVGGVSISDAFEGLSTVNSYEYGESSSNNDQQQQQQQPPPPTTLYSYDQQQQQQQQQESYGGSGGGLDTEPSLPQPSTMRMAPSPPPLSLRSMEPPPPAATAAVAASTTTTAATAAAPYAVGTTNEELDKMKQVLQNMHAENISLKAQLGTMTEAEKDVQRELGQTIADIATLSETLDVQRQYVVEAKQRLLDAQAELQARQDTKSVLTELIGEARQTQGAIEEATETVLTANQAVANTAVAPSISQPTYANDRMAEPNSDPFGAPRMAAAAAPQYVQEGADSGNRWGVPTPITTRPSAMDDPWDGDQGGNDYNTNITMAAGDVGGATAASALPSPTTPNRTSTQSTYTYDLPPPSTQLSGVPASRSFDGPAAEPFAPPQQSYGEQQQPPQQHAPPPPVSYGNYDAASPPPASYPDPNQNYGAPPPPASYPDPNLNYGAPPQQQQQQQLSYPTPTNIDRPNVLVAHNRQLSGFGSELVMGGGIIPQPQENISEYGGGDGVSHDVGASLARSHASSGDYGYDDQAFEIVDGMKKKAKSADKAARQAEANSRRLSTEADELRGDADKAEANSRSLQAQLDERDKKKKKFGGGKKTKKLEESAQQAQKDAAEIKKRFMAIQTQAYEAATLAAKQRSAADRLRDEAEAAELQMVSAASQQHKQPGPPPPAAAPAPAPVSVPPQQQQQQQQQQHHPPLPPHPHYGGGDSYGVGPPPAVAVAAVANQQQQPYGGGPGMEQQQMMRSPANSNGGYTNYGQAPPPSGGGGAGAGDEGAFGGIPTPTAHRGGFTPMGGGEYPYAPGPGMEAPSDPYASPF